jgi:hypothetical protein
MFDGVTRNGRINRVIEFDNGIFLAISEFKK